MPRLHIPFLLIRYLAQRYLASFLLTLFVLTSFVFLIDVVEQGRKLSETPQASMLMAFQLSLWHVPSLMVQLSPFVVLFGTLLCFSRLNRDRELVAIRNAGLPARFFLLPGLLVTAGIGVLQLSFAESGAAIFMQRYESQMRTYGLKATQSQLFSGGQLWVKQQDGASQWFLHASQIDDAGRTLHNISLFQMQNHKFINRYDADKMLYQDKDWLLQNAQKFDFSSNQPLGQLQEVELPLHLTPKVLTDSFAKPQSLTIQEILALRQQLKEAGLATYEYDVHWFQYLAKPFLLAAFFLMAAPFALRYSRTHNTAQVLLVGVLVGIAFYIFYNTVMAYGLSGRIAPIIAAWAPTFVAGLLGAAMLLHFREE